jgi:multidrug efflux pump subunit AcrA (membrane-fusion protein)
MSKKNRALKALLILALVVALCMYFARTVQTITTPKVKLVQASQGRLEQKLKVKATPYFPVKTEVTLKKAVDFPVRVDKVYVKPGLFVKEGDTLFTASLTGYEAKEKELLDKYNEKAQALIDLDIKNRKNSKQSKQNDLYDIMIDAQEKLTEAENKARVAASEEGVALTFDQSTWRGLAQRNKATSTVMDLIAKAETAKATFDAARTDFYNSYENRTIKVKDEVFKYIVDRTALQKEMRKISDDMVELLAAKESLSTVKAASAGYIVAMDVKPEEAYDGVKSAYTIAKEGDVPLLRADVTDLKKDVAEGAKVEVAGEYQTLKTKVTAVVDETDGRQYAEIELTEEILRNAGGMGKLLRDGEIEASIVFKAKKNATIIPASALRSEGGGDEYIFLAEYSYGGFLSSGGIVARKTSVTVIDRSDKAVSIQEDLSYQSIIDRADRTIEDGKPVMEYVE